MTNVLFVCLGNICRSPMAEAVFRETAKRNGKADQFNIIDSCGTSGFHIGDHPDTRTLEVCNRNNVPIKHEGRALSESDFYTFDYIFAMDNSNLANINRLKPKDSKAVVSLIGAHREDMSFPEIVDDPYYGGKSGFQRAYEQLTHFSEVFLKRLDEK
ncbi:phosphotyrosine protein phosphatase I superfamily [Yarrowia lipolytica]|nr:hypothetical protein YALI1_E38701g [Yarrowia lipolytica]KAB8285439.1 phosphotyrosine protein phosphatase I superfamily [Yarrowia lipolytica]KAE8175472.1 phosphotyrosine protein phosphatase I superfamily [Yarrowia lipolytica]KAJ8057676.1 phosphotyrosine protein phosphatase I superfamily [Yarrowia lipolytica]QNQ00996.1 Low molecular weight phosphotyrosine protein phosphatase [Yarrowia lipolytica]